MRFGARKRGVSDLPSDARLIQDLVIPTFVLDRDRKVVLWNKAMEDLSGFMASEVIGTSNHWQVFYDHERPCLADLFYEGGARIGSPDGGAALYAASADASAGKRARQAENWCNMPRRGQRRYLMIDASAVYDDKGALVAVVETLRDTTSEQDAKAALKAQQEAQQSAIAEQLSQACKVLGGALDALAAGDLTCQIREAMPGPLDALRGNLNAAVDRLAALLRQTTSLSDTIRSGSSEIARSSDDLSGRTEQQAANLEETAAALQQIMVTVKKTAAEAARAGQVVAETTADAARSKVVVADAIKTMSRVEQSSGKIVQIISVIDDIAFQTNLLALNAGVEAARAGESGRGFAVVASEVRALAQRSAEAAKEIKALITAAAEEVDKGVALVAQTGSALQAIATRVFDLDHVVREFSSAAQEQAAGLGEINAAIGQMDQMTQRNASMVLETTAVTRDLLEKTSDLELLLAQFRTHGGGPAAAPGSIRGLQRALDDSPFGAKVPRRAG